MTKPLRELSIRELSDIEMDLVSGGEGDVDEIVVTAPDIQVAAILIKE